VILNTNLVFTEYFPHGNLRNLIIKMANGHYATTKEVLNIFYWI
jgi:hypothetical protein